MACKGIVVQCFPENESDADGHSCAVEEPTAQDEASVRDATVANDEELAQSLAAKDQIDMLRQLAEQFGVPLPPGGGQPGGQPGAPGEPAQRPGGQQARRAEQRPTDMVMVACEIGDVAVEMLVDTGAQISVITAPLVQRLGLHKMLDSSAQGIAAGVGHARIIGKLVEVPIRLGNVDISIDFIVLGVEEPMLILGLDQLKKYNCHLDMQESMILFGGAGGIEVPFLMPQPKPVQQCGCPQM